MRTRAIACLATLLATSITAASLQTTTAAFAQAMDADTKEAKALFEAGVALYKAGNYEDARVKFKAAYGLKKRPSIIINLARSELQTKRPLDAAQHFREVIALSDAKPEDKEDAKTGLADARKQLGVIMIDAPSDKTVQIDGATVTVPDDGYEVSPGSHSVSIKAGGKETNEKVSLDAGKSATVKMKAEETPVPVPVPVPDTGTATGTGAGTGTGTGTATPPDTGTGTTTTTSTSTSTTSDVPSNQPGFFASIHPVTYASAGATIIFGALWIGFYSAMNTHKDNADKLSAAIQSSKDKSGTNTCISKNCASWRSQGNDEINMFNTDKTLAITFGIATGVALAATAITFVTMRKKTATVGFGAAPTWGGATLNMVGAF